MKPLSLQSQYPHWNHCRRREERAGRRFLTSFLLSGARPRARVCVYSSLPHQLSGWILGIATFPLLYSESFHSKRSKFGGQLVPRVPLGKACDTRDDGHSDGMPSHMPCKVKYCLQIRSRGRKCNCKQGESREARVSVSTGAKCNRKKTVVLSQRLTFHTLDAGKMCIS